MNDDDVVLLLDRAAGLAPERLDREPVAAVARRRGRRRGALSGLVLAGVVGLGVAVVPETLGDREVLTPAGGQDVTTEFFALELPVNEPGTKDFTECLPLAGAGLVSGPASLSPTAVVSAVGTNDERRAVEQCLRTTAGVTPVHGPDLRAVEVSVVGAGLGALVATTSPWSYPWLMSAGRMHDLTLTNTADEPVFVQDLSFGTVLPSGLFAGIGCTAAEHEGEVVSGCFARYAPITLAPGEQRSFPVNLTSGAQQGSPLPIGTHEVEVPVVHRATAAFGDPRDTEGATRGTVRIRYDITGPSAVRDVSRVAFRPLLRNESGEPVYQYARATGELGGDSASGCLWLTSPTGERTPLLLLSDSASADFSQSPFRVVDGETVLATEGDSVELGGGADRAGGIHGCPVEGVPFVGYFTSG